MFGGISDSGDVDNRRTPPNLVKVNGARDRSRENS